MTYLDTDRNIYDVGGEGSLAIGIATVVVTNEDGLFWSGSSSNIDEEAKIRIWMGWGGYNIPVFAGTVHAVRPQYDRGVVILESRDYMGLFFESIIDGSQLPNETVKTIIEGWCSDAVIASSISSTDEYTETLTQPTFDKKSTRAALEDLCDATFSVAYFNEVGTLLLKEREYSSKVAWVFDDDNVDDCYPLTESTILNKCLVEYRDSFRAQYKDQLSIDRYGEKEIGLRREILNSVLVAEKTEGGTVEELDNDLEGFKFTTEADAINIDSIGIRMSQSSASGNVTVKVYTDESGSPDSLLAESDTRASGDMYGFYPYEYFYFTTPVDIEQSSDYWCLIDTSSVTGTINALVSAADSTSKHVAGEDGAWTVESDKWILHKIRGSVQAQRVAEDTVRFYAEPKERIRILCPGAPHLELQDEIFVDIAAATGPIVGWFVQEGVRNTMSGSGYTSIFTYRKRGI